MKCPKCGSTNISTERRLDGFNTCLKCGYKWKNGVEPKLTIAEMLLWLAENTNIGVTKTCMLVNGKTLCWNNETAEILAKKGQKAIMVKDLTEAIKQAYDWARKEERI